jgi:hypothetical protein
MARYKLIAFNNPVPGREDEYNDWYSHTHLSDVLRVPGFLTAQRFRLAPAQQPGTEQRWRYVAIYDCEADSGQQLLDALAQRVRSGELPLSRALAEQRHLVVLEPLTEVMHREGRA